MTAIFTQSLPVTAGLGGGIPVLYATITDLSSLSYAKTLLANNEFTPDEMNSALASASETVNSYLRRRYNLPLVSWGEDLVQVTCDIAWFRLISKRGYDPNGQQDQVFRQIRDDAIDWLDKVGNLKLHPNIVEKPASLPAMAVSSLPSFGWEHAL